MDSVILDREEFSDFAQCAEGIVPVQEGDDIRWSVGDFAGAQEDFRSACDGALVRPYVVDVPNVECVYGRRPFPREMSTRLPMVNSNRPGAGRERTLRRIG